MADYIKVLSSIREALVTIIEEIDKNLPVEKVEAEPDIGGRIVVSCDGSILKNPGGRATIGTVIQVPSNDPIEIARFTNATTNNEAEFDAIYVGLSNVFIMSPVQTQIVVESDSKLVVDALNGECMLKEPRLIKKRDAIYAMIRDSWYETKFVWKRRNSTSGLRRANDLAQTLNGVKPH